MLYFGIPSYKRSKEQPTLKYLKSFGINKENIIISTQIQDNDFANYEKLYSNDAIIIKNNRKGVGAGRNAILEYCPQNSQIVMLDDDIKCLQILSGTQLTDIITKEQFFDFINKAFEYAEKNNAKLWGVYPVNNAYFMKNTTDKQNILIGCVMGIKNNEISFDEAYTTKEDYELCCREITNGHNCIRFNYVTANAKHKTNSGGCKDVWRFDINKANADRLIDKYPNLIVRNTKKADEVRFIKQEGISKTYGSPRWTGEIADCSLPVTFDTYSNCSFGCVYCFSQYQRAIGKQKVDYLAKKVKCIDVEKTKKLFTGEKKGQFWEYLKDRRPIQWGGLSDQFDEFERKYGQTYEILKFLKEINYPISFSTKSAWVFSDLKYQELFRGQKNWNVKFSIITLDEENAKKIERGVPTPRARLEAMKKATELGMTTTLRLRPFIIGVSSKDYLDLIREAHKSGATAVTTEFFCLEMRSIKQAKEHYDVISKCAGIDIVEFYRKYSNGSGYLRLNRKIKEKYLIKMRDLCKELGMRFYVSDAHFKELSDNGCCCGLPADWEYSRGNFSYALQVAKRNGRVFWSDIENDMYFLDNFEWFKAEGFNCNSSEARAKYTDMTMKDYLHYLWNNPERGQSPYKIFERVLEPDGYDKHGDIIYKYNDSVTTEKCTHQCCSCGCGCKFIDELPNKRG